MSDDLKDPDHYGGRWRALVRHVLGPPGSLARWVVGTTVWLFVCLLIALYVGWLSSIALFVFATLVAIAAFKARSLAIGDEDEFRAALRREVAQMMKSPAPEDGGPRLDPEHGLSPGDRVFDGALPSPSAAPQDADGEAAGSEVVRPGQHAMP